MTQGGAYGARSTARALAQMWVGAGGVACGGQGARLAKARVRMWAKTAHGGDTVCERCTTIRATRMSGLPTTNHQPLPTTAWHRQVVGRERTVPSPLEVTRSADGDLYRTIHERAAAMSGVMAHVAVRHARRVQGARRGRGRGQRAGTAMCCMCRVCMLQYVEGGGWGRGTLATLP